MQQRRQFIQSTGLAAVGLTLTSQLPAAPSADAAQVVQGKDPRLQVHDDAIPVLETPTELLTEQITPLNVLFVRNNQPLDGAATTAPFPAEDWTIEFSGEMTPKRVQVKLADIAKMKTVEHEMVLQCCGNQRALYGQAAPVKGTQWMRGGMGNIRVTGVPLSAVMEELGIQVSERARYLTAAGKDEPVPGKEDFEHSLPVAVCRRRSLLALQFNGEPIPAVHGGPVRLVTPGFYGTNHIKWLDRVRFETKESENHNHLGRYRTPRARIEPGATMKYTVANSKASWRMKLKSVVLSPAPQAKLRAGEPVVVQGVVFNDGAARIEAVLLSTDQGKSWRRAKVKKGNGRYAWRRWEAALRLEPGEYEIWARAVDALGRSQPLDGSVTWNPSGYEWNGVERIPIVVG